jgi:hypothetical protein
VHAPAYHTKADRTLPPGANTYFWNYPPDTQQIQARAFYNILDESWEMPDVLRTRDRLPFVQGSALLYEITGETKYLEKAVEFADAIIERQFTDWEKPIEGCFGNFYEFPGNDEVFFHEFMQGGFWWQGNVEALNLKGFMHLLRLAPDHPRAAAWRNAIETYAYHYARPASALNPLGVYPVACYRDPEHGGIKNFQNILMGSSCLYGFSAKNFMVLANVLDDARFQTNAIAGVNFIAGLNPGVPNAYEDTAWDARTLILGVGRAWFGPAHRGPSPLGSVPNGFCASPQFWQPGSKNFISYQKDRPAGLISPTGRLYFNEDWILHSHAYVQGVAHLEGPFTLAVNARDDGAPVDAEVTVRVREVCAPHTEHTRSVRTSAEGLATLSDLPTPAQGVVRVAFGDRVIERPVAAVAGGSRSWAVDFARDLELEIQVPELLAAGAAGEAAIRIRNTGTKDLALKLVLSAGGVTLDRGGLDVTLKPGEAKTETVAFTAGAKIMPYLVRAWVAEGAPSRAFHATGRIRSTGTQP